MFWETKSDVHNELVARSIRRNRFLEIPQYLHTCDNLDLPEHDKFGKLRQYFDMLNEFFGKNSKYLLTSNISIDETMVPYYGKHSTTQHIHGKPIRFVYKLWSVCTPSGYLIHFIPYEGPKANQLPMKDSIGLGAAVVLNLLHKLPKDIDHYSLYFDNFFIGLPLLDILLEMGHAGTGTIRENRTEKCPLPGMTTVLLH
ncbi:piggyBac transposable element-derived protein 3-like [Palaemon carinicauda]|uniref:piggyBac transposable element-derived protein 3-like n=1 Tax=Palaemon carinicauda TaxID=392227 RepID=UPI0035B5A8D0